MEEELKQYGLSDKEVKVYLACLKKGNSTANDISELSEIRRSTVYEVIETLRKKGFISSFKFNKKTYFNSLEPEKILNLIKDKESLIRNIIPSLNNLKNSVLKRPNVEMFEGKLGIKAAVEDMLNSSEILVYGASSAGDRLFEHYTENFARRRVKKKIFMRAVLERNFSEHMSDKIITKYTKVKTLDSLKNHTTVYFIYDDKLLLLTLGNELIALRITSPLLVESQKKIFESLWSMAK